MRDNNRQTPAPPAMPVASAGGVTRQSLDVAHGAVSFLEWRAPPGERRPALHFAHATGFNALTYRTLLSPLGQRFHVWASDARGHGMTQLPAEADMARDWSLYRDDLVQVLESLADKSGGPVLLAGHSMGATVSMMAAVRRPDLVRGLMLLEPVLIPRSYYRLVRWARALRLPIFGGMALAEIARRRRADWPSRETMARAYRGRSAFSTWPEAVLRDYIEGGVRDTPDGVTLACRPAWEAATFEARSHDAPRLIRQVSRPLAVLYAETGTTCRRRARATLRRHRRLAFMECCRGTSHFLPMEKPERVRDAIAHLDALC